MECRKRDVTPEVPRRERLLLENWGLGAGREMLLLKNWGLGAGRERLLLENWGFRYISGRCGTA